MIMRTTCLSVLCLFACGLSALAQTNTVPIIGPLSPVLDLLPAGAAAVLMKAIVWIGSFGLLLAPFSVWIQHKLTDLLNTAAASADVDDDAWLKKLFTNPVYRFAATLLRFLHIRLPTIADLERALSKAAE